MLSASGIVVGVTLRDAINPARVASVVAAFKKSKIIMELCNLSYYVPPFELHRSLLIIPPLIIGSP